MRLYRYSWRRTDPFLADLTGPAITLKIEAKSLGLIALVTRPRPGFDCWLRVIRKGVDDELPMCAVAGSIKLVFAVIREVFTFELSKRMGVG